MVWKRVSGPNPRFGGPKGSFGRLVPGDGSLLVDDLVAKTRTNMKGEFALEDVPPGRWLVGPAPKRSSRKPPRDSYVAPVPTLIEVHPGATEQGVLVQVHRGLYIRGTVVEPDGKPAARALVSGSSEEPDFFWASNNAENDGSFALGPLIPGMYRLTGSGGDGWESDSVVASAGDEEVILQLRPGGGMMGQVLDENGALHEAELTIIPQGPDSWRVMLSDTTGAGRFDLEGFAPGLYVVQARTSDGLVGLLRDVAVASGAQTPGLAVIARAGAELVVRCEVDASYFEVSSNGIVIESDGFADDMQSRVLLSPGIVTVAVILYEEGGVGQGPRLERTVELVAGEETEVVFKAD